VAYRRKRVYAAGPLPKIPSPNGRLAAISVSHSKASSSNSKRNCSNTFQSRASHCGNWKHLNAAGCVRPDRSASSPRPRLVKLCGSNPAHRLPRNTCYVHARNPSPVSTYMYSVPSDPHPPNCLHPTESSLSASVSSSESPEPSPSSASLPCIPPDDASPNRLPRNRRRGLRRASPGAPAAAAA
jgi:hypothetical protein